VQGGKGILRVCIDVFPLHIVMPEPMPKVLLVVQTSFAVGLQPV
jgi:hypothetical protein